MRWLAYLGAGGDGAALDVCGGVLLVGPHVGDHFCALVRNLGPAAKLLAQLDVLVVNLHGCYGLGWSELAGVVCSCAAAWWLVPCPSGLRCQKVAQRSLAVVCGVTARISARLPLNSFSLHQLLPTLACQENVRTRLHSAAHT